MSSLPLYVILETGNFKDLDTPAYLRKHGSVFREKFWKPANNHRRRQINPLEIQ